MVCALVIYPVNQEIFVTQSVPLECVSILPSLATSGPLTLCSERSLTKMSLDQDGRTLGCISRINYFIDSLKEVGLPEVIQLIETPFTFLFPRYFSTR